MSEPARRAVAAIVRDLSDRNGLKREWRQIDPRTRAEIIAAWESIVRDAIADGDE